MIVLSCHPMQTATTFTRACKNVFKLLVFVYSVILGQMPSVGKAFD